MGKIFTVVLVIVLVFVATNVYAGTGDLNVIGDLTLGSSTQNPLYKLLITKDNDYARLALMPTGPECGSQIDFFDTNGLKATIRCNYNSDLNMSCDNNISFNCNYFFVSGIAMGTTPWYQYSDRRLKKNIAPLSGALDKVMKLRGVTFEWNEENLPEAYKKDSEGKIKKGEIFPKGSRVGLIAQEVNEVVPEVVTKKGEFFAIASSDLTGLLIEAIKEQQRLIEAQEKRIKRLEEKMQ
ncbi:MAG: tail fiber domain-containing protein [Candidatus Omnitrophica bacterium]|nr:tail fiber domain-containing protein [Candidatus Omnitrophota bacterium]